MRIAHLVSTFPPYFGGMGNAAFGMAEESVRRGHEVTVLTPRAFRKPLLNPSHPPFSEREGSLPPFQKGDRGGFAIRHLRPFGRYGNAAFLPQLFWLLDDYDIVHLHYPFFGGAEVAALWRMSQRRKSTRRLVVTYHMDAIADGWLGRFFTWHNRYILPGVLNIADRIIVTSKDYAEHSLLKNYESPHQSSGVGAGQGRIKNKSIEIPLGVDTEFFSPRERDAELLRQYRIDPASFVTLFVGALDRAHQFKGVEVLLRAFALFSQFQGVGAPHQPTLVIVGDGGLRPSYAALAKELGVQERVVFTGRVSADDLPRYYGIADSVALPSTNQSEAFGMVALEAMASGKPVIASNLPGVRKVVIDRKTGILTKPGDVVGLAKAMEILAQDPELRVKYGSTGRERALEQYTWEKIGEELERVYENLSHQ